MHKKKVFLHDQLEHLNRQQVNMFRQGYLHKQLSMSINIPPDNSLFLNCG